MNAKRFTAPTAREAMALVRRAFGDDAVVLSNKPCAEGVEVLAAAPEAMSHFETIAASAPRVKALRPNGPAAGHAPSRVQARPGVSPRASFAERSRAEPGFDNNDSTMGVGQDVQALAMSTLSFQDYVRERVLKRRQAELQGRPDPLMPPMPPAPSAAALPPDVPSLQAERRQRTQAAMQAMQPRPQAKPASSARVPVQQHAPTAAQMAVHTANSANKAAQMAMQAQAQAQAPRAAQRTAPPVLRDELRVEPSFSAPGSVPTLAERDAGRAGRDQEDMMNELRSMKGLIEQRFGALAFMEKLQRHPAQARLTQRLLELGFSPALVRRMIEGLPADQTNEEAWATHVLARNLQTAEAEPALEEQGGVFALIGSTGVGKTTTTAKIAAAFATRYGAAHLGLITLDAYRVGAHEQLRAYGRILGVPVHTAHDRASLDDLLELLAGKKMVLIDTAGTAQRDSRTPELLDMVARPSIRRLLVVNAAQQGETLDDVVGAWRGAEAQGVVLSKIDEAVRLGPALDTMIRHRLRVVGVANGQRVPEDWHRLSAQALVQSAMRGAAAPAWKMDAAEVNLVFAASPSAGAAMAVPAGVPVH